MDLIEKLEEEIWQQIRNGRKSIYVEADDLRALGYDIDKNKKGRTFIDLEELRAYIKRYKFKNDLKVDVKPEKTFKDLENEIRNKERGRDREDD